MVFCGNFKNFGFEKLFNKPTLNFVQNFVEIMSKILKKFTILLM